MHVCVCIYVKVGIDQSQRGITKHRNEEKREDVGEGEGRGREKTKGEGRRSERREDPSLIALLDALPRRVSRAITAVLALRQRPLRRPHIILRI